MTREESAKWAALLQAQADGKQLEFLWAKDTWRTRNLDPIGMVEGQADLWRIAPDLPPKPSQEWLDKHGVELTGECRIPIKGDLVSQLEIGGAYQPGIPWNYSVTQSDVHWQGPRWILRRRAPVVKPWTIDTVPMPLVVIHKQSGRLAVCVSADKDGVWLISNTLGGVIIVTYANLILDFTKRDGSPCGEVAK